MSKTKGLWISMYVRIKPRRSYDGSGRMVKWCTVGAKRVDDDAEDEGVAEVTSAPTWCHLDYGDMIRYRDCELIGCRLRATYVGKVGELPLEGGAS